MTFLAILELAKEQLVDIVQAEPFAPIYVRAAIASGAPTATDRREPAFTRAPTDEQ